MRYAQVLHDIMLNTRCFFIRPPGLVLLCVLVSLGSAAATTLEQAVQIAIANDAGLSASEMQEQSLLAQGAAADTLPNPVMSVGIANLPTDGFAFEQEPMTQLKVGIAQQFPRGDSIAIRQQQFMHQAQAQPFVRADRKAQIRQAVTLLWLQALSARQQYQKVSDDRSLFEQLVQIVENTYASAVGNTRQQDVLRAQVELARLDDRLNAMDTQFQAAKARLSEWLAPTHGEHRTVSLDDAAFDGVSAQNIALPEAVFDLLQQHRTSELAALLGQHPTVRAYYQSVRAAESAVALSEQ